MKAAHDTAHAQSSKHAGNSPVTNAKVYCHLYTCTCVTYSLSAGLFWSTDFSTRIGEMETMHMTDRISK